MFLIKRRLSCAHGLWMLSTQRSAIRNPLFRFRSLTARKSGWLGMLLAVLMVTPRAPAGVTPQGNSPPQTAAPGNRHPLAQPYAIPLRNRQFTPKPVDKAPSRVGPGRVMIQFTNKVTSADVQALEGAGAT